jgi:hypothetical protein
MDLPYHQYVTIDAQTIHDEEQYGVWFAIQSNIGGVWGGHVLLGNGALYRNVPLHRLRLGEESPVNGQEWRPNDLQFWNCYSATARVHEYTYLRGLRTSSFNAQRQQPHKGTYLFTIIPTDDPFSRHPEQSKELVVSAISGTNRIAIRATNEVLFHDKSIAGIEDGKPTGLYRQSHIPSSE